MGIKRVWMCEFRKQVLVSVTCKADAVALCVTCDFDIRSANPLTRRHERIPVEPFFDSVESVIKSGAPLTNFLMVPTDHNESPKASLWILPNQNFVEDPNVKPADLLFTPKP